MTLDEIEERVKQTLEALNTPEELYDWRLTHYNFIAWTDLQEGCYALSQAPSEEKERELLAETRNLIKAFRDRSEISYIDFCIKAPEPGKDEFKRMGLLFEVKAEHRLLPPRDVGDRRAYMQLKILEAMTLAMEHKQVVSEKLRQQFNFLMLRASIKTPEMLGVQLKFESYNQYQKHLAPAPKVNLRNHFMETKPDELTPATPMFETTSVDNSTFESRLPPTPSKTPKQVRTTVSAPWADTYKPGPEPMPIVVSFTPQDEIHEEFAAYCRNLYEKAKGN